MSESFLNDRVTLHCGDCRDVLAHLEENSIDSCVTDPPYHLISIVKRFGSDDATAPKVYKTGAYGGGFDPNGTGTGAAFARMSRGFMGKQWDGGDIAFRPELWAAVYRVPAALGTPSSTPTNTRSTGRGYFDEMVQARS